MFTQSVAVYNYKLINIGIHLNNKPINALFVFFKDGNSTKASTYLWNRVMDHFCSQCAKSRAISETQLIKHTEVLDRVPTMPDFCL